MSEPWGELVDVEPGDRMYPVTGHGEHDETCRARRRPVLVGRVGAERRLGVGVRWQAVYSTFPPSVTLRPGAWEGAEAYRGFIGPFLQVVTGSNLIAAFGDDETALLMYDTETVPVKSAPGAECVTVKQGKITDSRFIFDRAPFDAVRARAS